MTTKTITVTEDAYEFLKGIKKEDESFSNLLVRLAKEKSIAEKYFGVLGGEVTRAKERIKKLRKGISKDLERREDVFFGYQRSS